MDTQRLSAMLTQAWDRISNGVKRLAIKTARLARRAYFRVYHFLVCGLSIFLRKRGARAAAQCSFNVALSICPMLICMNWLVGKLHANYDIIFNVLSRLLPPAAISFAETYLNYLAENQSSAMLIAGVVMLVMPSSAALRALQCILCEIENRGRKNSVWNFILSYPLSLVLLVVIYFCMTLLFISDRLLIFLTERLRLDGWIRDISWLRFLAIFLIIAMMLYLLYRFLPFNVKRPRDVFIKKKIYPGVLFSSTAFVIVNIIFSWFISMSTRYSLVYGSLASIVILMLWIYCCCNIIIIGGVVNRIFEQYGRHVKHVRG